MTTTIRTSTATLNVNAAYGPLPANLEAEEAVLAHLLFNPRQIASVTDTLSPDHFYRDRHATVYRAMCAISARGKLPTVATLTDELLRGDTTGETPAVVRYELEMWQSAFYPEPLATYVDLVTQAATYRRLLEASAQIAQLAYQRDPDAVQTASDLIYQIVASVGTKDAAPLSEVLARYLDTLTDRRADFAEGIPSGIPSGFRRIDALLGGLRPSQLITIAARPGDGKTALALLIALYVTLHARRALFFSLEMDEDELAQRVLAVETHINQSLLQDGDIDETDFRRVEAAARRLGEQCDLLIDDRTRLLSDMRAKARREHARKPLGLIVIDYLQLVDAFSGGRPRSMQRPEEVALISKQLKQLARELHVPVIALAQMNRDIEARGKSAKPQLSDLGDSSGIEKDSDVVMFLHCPDAETERRDQSEPYTVEAIVRKARNARKGTARLRFIPALTRFEDAPDDMAPIQEQGGRPYADDL